MPHLFPGSRPPKIPSLNPEIRAWLTSLPLNDVPQRISDLVRSLPAPRNRLHSPDRMAEADQIILKSFQATGLDATLEQFSFSNVVGFADHGTFGPTHYDTLKGANVVAYKRGNDPSELLVVMGHHDTIRDSPGANDNTASVAALLELARLIAPFRFARSILLAATDMEELGFFGARALVASLERTKRVNDAINYETMGFTSSAPGSQLLPPGLGYIYSSQVSAIQDSRYTGDFTTVIYRGSSSRCAAQFASSLGLLAGPRSPLLLRDPNDLPILGRLLGKAIPFVRQFARSDHVPFWEAGLPAIQITDTANFRYRHYHQPTDTPEHLDFLRLAQIVGATAATLASQAGLLNH